MEIALSPLMGRKTSIRDYPLVLEVRHVEPGLLFSNEWGSELGCSGPCSRRRTLSLTPAPLKNRRQAQALNPEVQVARLELGRELIPLPHVGIGTPPSLWDWTGVGGGRRRGRSKARIVLGSECSLGVRLFSLSGV